MKSSSSASPERDRARLLRNVHPNAHRVQAALRAGGSSAEVIHVPDSTRTAVEAAAALGTTVAQIVKSLVFVANDEPFDAPRLPSDSRTLAQGRPVLVLTSGSERVSTEKVRAIVGVKVTRPDADLVRRLTGYAIGGIPPLAHDTPALVLMDPHLLRFDVVWAAAGTPHAVFGIAPQELQRITGAEVLDVTE